MRLASVLLALALPASLAGTPAVARPDQSDGSARQQGGGVSLGANANWVKKGDLVRLSGKVRGVRRKTAVTIYQKKFASGSTWNVEARKRTTRKGKFRHTEDIRTGDRMYKACTKGRCSPEVTVRMGTPPTPPPPATQPTSLALASISVTSAEAGVPFTVSGSAINLDGQTIQIQAYDSGSSVWGAIGTAVVAGGQWSATASVTKAGRAVPVRAYFPGSVGLGASVTAGSPIAVFGWYYLYDRTPKSVGYSGDYDFDTWNINGVNYSKSVGIPGSTGRTYWVEFDLSRSCTRLAATVGMDDSSATTTRTTARINVDSVNKWSMPGMQLGQSYPVSIDISSGLRLRLETSETTDGSGYGVFGDVRTLCAF